jgi:opacity protein-like surface antigen
MSDRDLLKQMSLVVVFVVLLLAGSAHPAHAEGFISPFIGYNFGGDAGCPEVLNCEDKHLNWGVGFGALGSIVGFDAEIAHTNDFFGQTANQSSNVLTFLATFMLAPKLGPIRPYGLIGFGLIRTSADNGLSDDSTNQFGWDAGGGLMVHFGRVVGIKGEVRYFHSFEVLDLLNLSLPGFGSENKLDFGRADVGIVFTF